MKQLLINKNPIIIILWIKLTIFQKIILLFEK